MFPNPDRPQIKIRRLILFPTLALALLQANERLRLELQDAELEYTQALVLCILSTPKPWCHKF